MSRERIDYLLEHYYLKRLSSAEEEEFFALIAVDEQGDLEEGIVRLLQQNINEGTGDQLAELPQYRIDEIIGLDREADIQRKPIVALSKTYLANKLRQRWLWAAASLIFMIMLGTWYWLPLERDLASDAFSNYIETDFQPGQDGGNLFLGNGEKISLDSSTKRTTHTSPDQGVQVTYDQYSAVYMLDSASIKQTLPALIYNMIEVPNGRKYTLQLTDGTKIWLGPGSKLRFPIFFGGDQRQVYLSGEAHFEVSKDPHKPFVVKVENSDTKIEVLGTKFTVSSFFGDGSYSAALLEGKIRLYNKTTTKTLYPGEEAFAKGNGEISIEKKTMIDAGPKHNFFVFADQDILSIMKEFERWYNIKVDFEGVVSSVRYSGKIDKNLSFVQAMEVLGATDIKYRIEKTRHVIIITNL